MISIPDIDLTNTSVSGTSNWSKEIFHTQSIFSKLILQLLLSIFYSSLRSSHLNPNACHLETLVGVGHPVEEAECKSRTQAGHHHQVVGKQ